MNDITESKINSWLINNHLKQETAEVFSWKDFEGKFTLHDSSWLGMSVDVMYTGDVILGIDLDTHWQGDRIKKHFEDVNAYLFIRFSNVSKIELNKFGNEDIWNGISGAEYKNKILNIENIIQGNVTLHNVDEAEFWLFDKNLKQVKLFD